MNQYIRAAIITTSLVNISTYAMKHQTLVMFHAETPDEFLHINMLYTSDKLADLHETKKVINSSPKHTLSDLEIHTALTKAIEEDNVTLAQSYYDQIPTPSEAFQFNCFQKAEKKGNVNMIKMLFSRSEDNQKDCHARYIVNGAARNGHPDIIKLFPLSAYRFKIDWSLVLEIAKRYNQQKTEKFILDYLKTSK
ncbi:MAG TPA: hypothetical protein VKR54_00135 [Candidatus Babeliales bacterium]|nr:hypothetical protein [Candidatus Babeliales bacterium]